MKIAIIGASGKLGRYMIQHALDRGYEVVGVCREKSVGKLDAFHDRITIIPGATDDREVIAKAVAGCDGVLIVLVPWGVQQYSTGTAQAVLDHAQPGARLIFSCGWHITRDGKDVYARSLKLLVAIAGPIARFLRVADLNDQVEACRRIFESSKRWTVVRGSDLEEGESEGLPVWSRHVGDPILASNLTRRIDFALFMVAALTDDALVQEAPAIVGCRTPSALAHAGERRRSHRTGVMTKTVNLGPEFDQNLRARLMDVLRDLGATVIRQGSAVGGSQDIETLVATLDGHEIAVEAETYIGLSITGEETTIDEIVRRMGPSDTRTT